MRYISSENFLNINISGECENTGSEMTIIVGLCVREPRAVELEADMIVCNS